MRDNEGFRPELRGTFSRSRRDLAICAFNASNAYGAAPCRPQIELKLPIQVGVVSRRARTRARHRVRAKRRSLGDIRVFASPCGDLAPRSRDLCCGRPASAWGRAPQNPKVPKGSYTSRRLSSWGLRAKGGAARRQTEDFTREFFAMFVSSPRSSDPARPRRLGRLPKKVVFSTPQTPV